MAFKGGARPRKEKKSKKTKKTNRGKKISRKSKKTTKVTAAQKREAIKKLNELREKLVDLRRNDHPHFGDKSLVQPMRKSFFEKQDLSEEAPRKSGIVLFYANWCPHCHTVMPIMNELAEKINNEKTMNDMMVGAIDCATPENDDLSDEMGIQGYPTIKIYDRGNYVGDYNGPREVPFLITLLKKMNNN